MILVNGHVIDQMTFPDGTSSFRCSWFDLEYCESIVITLGTMRA